MTRLNVFYSIYHPNEIIIIYSGYNEKELDEVIQFSGIDCPTIHKVSLEESQTNLSEQANNCIKQCYQEELLKRFFTIYDYDVFYDSLHFKIYTIATQSYCFLLDFCISS